MLKNERNMHFATGNIVECYSDAGLTFPKASRSTFCNREGFSCPDMRNTKVGKLFPSDNPQGLYRLGLYHSTKLFFGLVRYVRLATHMVRKTSLPFTKVIN